MEIVATIGDMCKGDDLTALTTRLVSLGVNYLRFNMDKNGINADTEERMFAIQSIKEKLKVKIMLDLPTPNRKPRLLLNNKSYVVAKENDIIFISFAPSKCGCIYLNTSCKAKPKVGDIIYYSDYDSEWLVREVTDKGFSVKIRNSCKIYSGKSVCMGDTIECHDIKSYIGMVNDVRPYSVALSFVNHKSEICDVIDLFNSNVRIISKIETYRAVNNVTEIATLTDVMIGRGDLSMYANLLEMHLYQNEIVAAASKLKRNVYFATGILASLLDKSMASVAEIIDLSTIINYNPAGIILNYGVVKMNIERAIEIISGMYVNRIVT